MCYMRTCCASQQSRAQRRAGPGWGQRKASCMRSRLPSISRFVGSKDKSHVSCNTCCGLPTPIFSTCPLPKGTPVLNLVSTSCPRSLCALGNVELALSQLARSSPQAISVFWEEHALSGPTRANLRSLAGTLQQKHSLSLDTNEEMCILFLSRAPTPQIKCQEAALGNQPCAQVLWK